jgi:hypothetical protein
MQYVSIMLLKTNGEKSRLFALPLNYRKQASYRPLSIMLMKSKVVVRRDRAVKRVDVLAGESPARADCPVGTVVISGGGAGDQTVESPEVKALEGWRNPVCSDRRASKAAGRSASEP